jgi:Leucine-rich repeat (LRR) protein
LWLLLPGEARGAPKLPNILTKLNCFNNNLTELQQLPNTLKYLNCSNNQLTKLPNNLINCRSLRILNLTNNTIELTIQQINFLNWIQNRKLNNSNYYNDGQNVHNSSVQKSLVNSINNLLKN